MERITIDTDRLALSIKTDGTPEDVLRVKTLPGRVYDPATQEWTVPITPGLSKRLEAIFQATALSALVEECEARLVERLAAPRITVLQAFDMPVEEAIERAKAAHLYIEHHGDERDYIRHHGTSADWAYDGRSRKNGHSSKASR